jgi:hypothetical protein
MNWVARKLVHPVVAGFIVLGGVTVAIMHQEWATAAIVLAGLIMAITAALTD